MRDVSRAIEQIERVLEHVLDKSKPPKKEVLKTKSSTVRVWRAPATSDHFSYPEPKARSVFREKINMTTLFVTARAVKVTISLDPAAIAMLPAPSQERVELVVNCDGVRYTANIATKSLRKAKGIINTLGAEKVFAMLQGKLRGSEIVEVGLVAQTKTATKAAQGAT